MMWGLELGEEEKKALTLPLDHPSDMTNRWFLNSLGHTFIRICPDDIYETVRPTW